MTTTKNLRIAGLILLVTGLMANFQNCAPAHPGGTAASVNGGGQSQLVENLNPNQLQFVTSSVLVHDELSSADVGGLCNSAHEGAALEWSIVTKSGTTLVSGSGACGKQGQFDLHLTGLNQMACGVVHELKLQAEWGTSTSVAIEQRCQPLASVDVAVSDEPAGTQCALEYVPVSAEGQSPCSKSCYRQGQLMSQVYLDPGQCSGMISQLAGQ